MGYARLVGDRSGPKQIRSRYQQSLLLPLCGVRNLRKGVDRRLARAGAPAGVRFLREYRFFRRMGRLYGREGSRNQQPVALGVAAFMTTVTFAIIPAWVLTARQLFKF